MAVSLDALATAFNRLDRRPAVFDRQIRAGAGLWGAPEPVPVAEIVEAFAAHGGYTVDGERVYLPLHEAESAEPTGEYLVYRPDQPVPCIAYYDWGSAGLDRIPFETFGETYPAWRLRFWHPAFEPPSEPSFAGATPAPSTDEDEDEPGEPTTASTPTADAEPSTPAAVGIESDALFEALRSFVQREREAERAAARAAFDRLDIAQYGEQAGAIPALESAGMAVDAYGQQTVQLRVVTGEAAGTPDGGSVPDAAGGAVDVDIPDRYGIYPGMEVLVDTHDPTDGFPVEAEVVDIEGRQLDLSVYWTRTESGGRPETAFEATAGERFVVGELLNPVPSDRELEAIAAVEDDDRKAGLLTGSRTPAADSALDVSVPKAGLNTHQFRAAQQALMARDVHCIHGPPGTGKTRTLVRIIRAAADAGLRVLACADSNQAVDNLLVGDSTADRADPRSLHALAESEDLTVARAGSNSSSDLVADRYADESVWTADVVCTTTNGAHQFGADVFDLAVVDEATQATVPSTLIPFVAAKRTILAGDHRQLPPYHASETDEMEAFEVSLFEHLLARYGAEVTTPLRTQYRMHRAIAAFPNAEFYDGQLEHGERNRDWTIGTLAPLAAVQVDGEEQQTPGRSYRNDAEAKAVGRIVSQLLHAGVDPGDVGVITPYSGQIGAIRTRLLDLHDQTVTDAIEIATVDAFQGSEREAIVLSFVRSNPDGYSGFLTFPTEGPRRLNVALTRARRRCVLVGNFETLRTRAPDRQPAESAAPVYDRLATHLTETGVMEAPGWTD